MEFKATLGTMTSKKNNVTYEGLYIQITDTYKKFVFLNEAELSLVKSQLNENKTEQVSEFPFSK